MGKWKKNSTTIASSIASFSFYITLQKENHKLRCFPTRPSTIVVVDEKSESCLLYQ
jgi:hypothetical protein